MEIVFTMTKVFIVGGAGFIGSHLVQLCLEQKYQVWVYDDFSTGRKEFLPKSVALHVVEGDILDTEPLSNWIDECAPDTLYHLAAIHYIPACEKMPERALRVNVEGTQNVLNACAQHPVPRILFASTGALYDPVNTGLLMETSPVKAHDIYSISKLSGEQLLKHHVSKNGGQAIITRFFNTVGRHETNPHIVPTIMAQLADGSRQIKLGNLRPRRDYVHVQDVAEALFILGSIPMEQPFDIFNIGSGQEYSVQELVVLCSEVIHEPIEIISAPELQRSVDRPNQLADLTKIHQVSGWNPKRTLKQALCEVWEESFENRAAYQHSTT
jgi:UDP-glucose 4-epimerase